MVSGRHVCSGAAVDNCVRSQVGELGQCPQQSSSIWSREHTAKRGEEHVNTERQQDESDQKQRKLTPHVLQIICMAPLHFVDGAQRGLCPTYEVICVQRKTTISVCASAII